MKIHNHNVTKLLASLATQSGKKALEVLFDLYYSALLTAAIVFVKSKDIAEEIVADVIYKLWENRKKATNIKNLDDYLFISIRNASLNYINKEKRIKKEQIEELSNESILININIENHLFAQELDERIKKGIDNLPPKCKQVFLLVRFDNLKYKEVAEKLNISVNTVENQMGIALKRLAGVLK